MSALLPFPALLQAVDPNHTPVTGMPFFLFTVLKLLIVFTVYMVGVAMLTLAERKISAWIRIVTVRIASARAGSSRRRMVSRTS